MTARQVQVERDGAFLRGTLTVPDGATTVVVFVHGSGPLDRDQNSATARLNTFADLAAALDGAGIASLRYDKRGVGKSEGDYGLVDQADLVADLRAWITLVADFDRVILCGHSEGTALAPLAADQSVDGLILICPYAETGAAILRRQAAQLQATAHWPPGWRGVVWRIHAAIAGGPVQQQDRLIKEITTSQAATIKVGGRSVPARWLRSFIAADPMVGHRQNTWPTLIIVAGQDAQCRPADGAVIAAENPNSTLVTFDDLSHILRVSETPGVADYARQLHEPTDPRIAAEIVRWIG